MSMGKGITTDIIMDDKEKDLPLEEELNEVVDGEFDGIEKVPEEAKAGIQGQSL